MNNIARLQPIIIILSALVGVSLGSFTDMGNTSSSLVEAFLMLLLYILFLSINLSQLKKSILHAKYISTSVFVNFVITPITAYLLGLLFFENNIEIRIGLLMLLVTPCTDWYLVFTKLSHGNVEMNMSLLPINLILQVALLPLYLLIFLGNSANMDMYALSKSVIFVLCIPFMAAMLTRYFILDTYNLRDFVSDKGDLLQLIFLCAAVVIMFASESKNLLDNSLLLLKLFIPLVCFFSITFFMVKILGKALHFSRYDTNALHMTTLARNSPLALAIAVSTFPNAPLISLALIIGPLIELPILSLVSSLLREKKI